MRLQQQRWLPAERRSVAMSRAQHSAHRASSDVVSPPLPQRSHGNSQRRRAGVKKGYERELTLVGSLLRGRRTPPR
ncbi:hypothetical protein ABB37_09962 [Leptomonas pyrrhocoris]|uniref:Uncharacterized protein n=1 Tax=Leptomonas pyrrhocoris TaxID=157538 RepID=A0A0M9FPC8_LEPPY|nr:hypothetical protein ABB37_09962 [Leptomonas pyrrhocoris]KPA73243.1 hypothetical protein ABB37_09962 [Leptomonas pyrrhocoris]|eukprot:XP_015651682.1 hypothetical protein ABB37_09962 [Leptomonas pyrrhocoris]